ncbi:hypothetical protein HNQ60_001174 [Povalibacter uvarum]|uniref:Uncharacterized protein n=1 Tax=Povalibacter uvarum TaxID=732238 RepID=A0A841HJD1_9GAMM|nr:hypothetical protein [Povalibacter uvarum]MBB6092328.1 hypothetical protein [Povalibacter uvarum]
MTSNHRLRFELIVASVLLGLGLFALPGVIFWVGTSLLGPYGQGTGVGTFYGDFYGDLASGVGRAWALALGPLVVVSLIRLLFVKRRAEGTGAEQEVPAAPPQPPTQDQRRVEPRVSLE